MEVGVLEAKDRLSELVKRAAAGEDVVITARGAPQVRLTPVLPAGQEVSEEVARRRRASMAAARQLTDEMFARNGHIGTWEDTKRMMDEDRA